MNGRTSKTLDNSERRARTILADYAKAVSDLAGDRLEAILLTGSLATGSYVPGPGDIDQITVVRDDASDVLIADIQRLREAVLTDHERAVNLSDVVYRRSQLSRPWQTEYDLRRETRHHATVPEEVLRIIDHGRVVVGNAALLRSLVAPTVGEMIEYHRRWRRWNDDLKRRNAAFAANSREPSVRLAVQSILSTAPWQYYFYTNGRTCFNKNSIARHIREAVPGYLFLDILDLATSIRVSGNSNSDISEANTILSAYQEFFRWVGAHDVNQVPVR
ncbi:MAG: hypothetical protein MUF78_04100 [Candidatus Edwardsbacteria bacterium]|jgi:hypothetical protein|nr:hypothetical protein [Candidatus Edwardsbacteria bacterium]